MKEATQNNVIENIKVRRKTFDGILNVFAWVSFFIALIVSIIVFLSTFTGSENGKSVFGYKMLIVQSDSMKESELSQDASISFEAGDLIAIKEVSDYSTIKVGDVITFVSYNPDSMGKTLSHKVKSIITTASGAIVGYETYGINTGQSDQAIVEPSTIIGKYVFKIPNFGHLFMFLKTPAGYFTSILVPCVLLIIFFSIKVGKWMARREIAKSYDVQLALFHERLLDIENKKGEALMQNNFEEINSTQEQQTEGVVEGAQESAQEQGTTEQVNMQSCNVVQQPMFAQQPMYVPNFNDKALELTIGSLNKTIETLSRTIENLVLTVEKPVDTLAHTVETLANATQKPTVVEKIIEKKVVAQPVAQPVVKASVVETPVAPQPQKVEPVVEPVVEQEISPVQEEVVETMEESANEVVEEKAVSLFDKLASHEKVAFSKKLLLLDSEIKNYFSEVHNELIAYKKVNYRISFKGISYKVGRKAIAKMAVRGKTLKLFLALDVNAYPNNVFFQEDSSSVKRYEEVPFTIKIKSNRGKNNALKLVSAVAENNNLVKNEQFKSANILKELKTIK